MLAAFWAFDGVALMPPIPLSPLPPDDDRAVEDGVACCDCGGVCAGVIPNEGVGEAVGRLDPIPAAPCPPIDVPNKPGSSLAIISVDENEWCD